MSQGTEERERDVEDITPNAKVRLPNGHKGTVVLTSGESALVRIGNASAWYRCTELSKVSR